MRLAVVIPALGLQRKLDRLLDALPTGLAVYVVDDGSEPPLRVSRGRLLRHPRNRGYGAAQKTGYLAALADGAEGLLLLHGDGQYEPAGVLALADGLERAEAVLGSRFLGAPTPGLPAWRALGVRALTAAANLRFGSLHTDLHNGARAFRAEALRALPFHRYADDYRFDHQLLAALLRRGARIEERPVPMHYGPDVLSISPGRALRYGLGCLLDLAR